jgi:hypothetical protein
MQYMLRNIPPQLDAALRAKARAEVTDPATEEAIEEQQRRIEPEL